MFSYSRECENIPLFSRAFTKIFSGILHFRGLILDQDFYQNIFISHMGLQHSNGMGTFFLMKRPNYPYCHPLPPIIDYPPPLVTIEPPPAAAESPQAVALCQGYFWKCVKYFLEFNSSTKCSKRYMLEKAISRDSIPRKFYS